MFYMSRVEKVETEVERMTAEELAAFRAWFERFDAEVWDREFTADAQAGKLDQLADSELQHHEAGRSSKL
jgi:hypothetical protein